MRKAGVGIGLAWFLFATAVIVFAQDKEPRHHNGKAGLWAVTTTTSWQREPTRVGTPGAPPRAGSHTTEVCLTQAMVDAGALLPQSRGQCHVQNKVIKPGIITADYICTGKMSGIGKLVSRLIDAEHVTGTIHFQGTLEEQPRAQVIEWTTISNAVFKTAQCSNNSGAAPAGPSPAP